MSGFEETDLDRAITRVLAKAPSHVKDSYKLALKRYTAVPFERRVELGFDPQLLRRLESVSVQMTKSEIQEIGREIFLPIMRKSLVPRRGDNPGNPRNNPGDHSTDLWGMKLAWTKIIAHDESDACLIICTEAGDDESVAIFVMLDPVVTINVRMVELFDQLSDLCKAQLLLAIATGNFSLALSGDPDVIGPECYQELVEAFYEPFEEADFEIRHHWIHRTDEFGLNDGSQEWGYILLTPQRESQGWQLLRESSVSEVSGVISISVPTHTVVAMIFELDNGVASVMDAVESHAESLEELAFELIKEALIDISLGYIWGAQVGNMIAYYCGAISIAVGAVLGPIIAYAVQPNFLGHGEMVFMSDGYKAGGDPMDLTDRIPLEAGRSNLKLRGMFTGHHSDYELDFQLTLRTSELTCLSFNPETIRVVRRWCGFLQRCSYIEDESGNKIASFRREDEAQTALSIIQHYAMTQQCQIGKPDPSMEYWLVNAQSPVGAFGGEDCVRFNPQNIEIKKVGDRWKIVDGDHWLLDFGERENEASNALSIIQQYGFNHYCFVGRPDPSMRYFRH